MKDEMYLYGFIVVASIVALILSVLSLTKKDKFGDMDHNYQYGMVGLGEKPSYYEQCILSGGDPVKEISCACCKPLPGHP